LPIAAALGRGGKSKANYSWIWRGGKPLSIYSNLPMEGMEEAMPRIGSSVLGGKNIPHSKLFFPKWSVPFSASLDIEGD
jgi:hypothetical protein